VGDVQVFSVVVAVVALLSAPTASRPGGEVVTASHVLHAWDARREAAWAASDTRGLRRLYAPGSAAATADVRLLRSYGDRRLVVRRIVTQVFALRVLHLDRRDLRIRVVDRIAGGVVDHHALGTTPPQTRVIAFRRIHDDWRVVSVTVRAPRRGPPARPGR
jgi:hypothetical protein